MSKSTFKNMFDNSTHEARFPLSFLSWANSVWQTISMRNDIRNVFFMILLILFFEYKSIQKSY